MYTITYKKSVKKDLLVLDAQHRPHVVKRILALATDPFSVGSVKLRGAENLYRVRSGDYRIIYSVSSKEVTILIIKVGHRKEIYRRV